MNARALVEIEVELEIAFNREAKGPVEIGGLLAEAKAQLRHGEWVGWLKSKFPHAVRTAQNFMRAHEFAGKYVTVTHLKLSPGAIYALARIDRDGDKEAVERVLQEAATQWTDANCVRKIIRELRSPPPVDEEPDQKPDGDEKPPPAPPPGLKPRQAKLVRDFDGAVAALKNLLTKRAVDLVAAAASKDDLETIANFLLQVAK
jgi:hypothetical protein